jgi:predicted dehydrogenase
VGIIGYALAGRVFHAPLVAAIPDLRVAAIVVRDAGRREQARHDFPDARLVDDADALFSTARDLALVVVASPNRTHTPYAMQALEAGLHVVVDKPFAVTAADGRRVIDEAARRGLVLSVFHNRRWDGDFLTLQRLLADGAIGDVLRFESRFERWRPNATGAWRESGDPAEAGGLIFDLGSHLIDQALVLFGPAAQVYAEADLRREGVHAEDDAFIAITHASGVRSHLGMSAVVPQSSARLRVVGRRATFTKYGLDGQEQALRDGMRPGDVDWGDDPSPWGQLATGENIRVIGTERGCYERFYELIAEAIRNGAPPPVDPCDAVEGLRVIEAAHQSVREGRIVQLSS